jgi:predicted cupin superfamily sugar epimerase
MGRFVLLTKEAIEMTDMHDRNGATWRGLVERFALAPHPEGGFYRETHRDEAQVLRFGEHGETGTAAAPRAASTCIYYLLCNDAYSAWHRIDADEVWHFYAGDPLDVHMIDGTGRHTIVRLGNALQREDAVFQAVVPAGYWFAAECADGARNPDAFALVGCTVAPGFEFSCFELADPDALAAAYPAHSAIFRRLAPRSGACR